jgi:hypothetical protein
MQTLYKVKAIVTIYLFSMNSFEITAGNDQNRLYQYTNMFLAGQ